MEVLFNLTSALIYVIFFIKNLRNSMKYSPFSVSKILLRHVDPKGKMLGKD